MRTACVLSLMVLAVLCVVALGEDNWLNQGATLRAEGKYDEALQAFDKATSMNPPFDAHAWFDKGTVYWQLDKYDEAIQSFEKSIELNSINPLSWYYKGVIFNDQGKYEEALQSIDRAIELNPNIDVAWYSKGTILKALGRDSEAVAALGKFAELLCDRFSTEHKQAAASIANNILNMEPKSPENIELEGTPTMSDSDLAMFTSRPVIPKPSPLTDQPVSGENI